MKKFVLRDEYEAISRDELKAFADEINNHGEAKRAKGADAEKARKVGKGFARSKVGKYLDNGKYEGIIYERENVLSREDLINENDDIKMMHHAGKFDGFNGGNGKSIKVIERKAKALEDINVDNVESVQVDECISNGKWNGKLVSHRKYDEVNEWIENNRLNIVKIFEIGEYDEDKKCVIDGNMFYFRKGKLFVLSGQVMADRYDLSNIHEVANDFAVSRRNSDVFIRRSKNIRGDKIIENVKDNVIEEEKVAVRNNSDGCIEEVKVDSEEVVEIKEFKRSNLMNIIIEDLDIMKRNDDELVSCKLKFKDEGKVYLNGGDYLSKSAGKYSVEKGGLRAEREMGSKVALDKNSKVVYVASELNGAIRVGKFNKESKAYDYIKVNRKEGKNAFSKLVINHRERHVAISERLVKYVKVGDKLAIIYNMDE